MPRVRLVALLVTGLLVLGGCNSAASSPSGIDKLPSDVAVEVATEPSICLIASDPDQVLMIITRSPSGQKDPGFLAVTVPGRPNEHDLAPGVDSRAVAGSYIVVGCNDDADMAELTRRAFADAERRGVQTTLWVKQDGAWSRNAKR